MVFLKVKFWGTCLEEPLWKNYFSENFNINIYKKTSVVRSIETSLPRTFPSSFTKSLEQLVLITNVNCCFLMTNKSFLGRCFYTSTATPWSKNKSLDPEWKSHVDIVDNFDKPKFRYITNHLKIWFLTKYFLRFFLYKKDETLYACIFKKESFFRSSHRRCSFTKVVLKDFTKFTRKYMCLIHFWELQAYNFIIKGLQFQCFPVNFTFLRASML